MRLPILTAALLLAAPAFATAQEATPLRKGEPREATLARGETHVYTIALDKDRFVFGTANQKTVDVIVRVIDPDGELVEAFNAPARGPEPFQFTSRRAGVHRIEIRAAKEEEGDYTLVVQRVEPKATTPEGTVDQLMAFYDGEDTPGGVVAVVEKGRVRFIEAYGMANLEHGVPNTPAMRFNIGSVTKQLTAFAIALLAEQGKLSLDDDVRVHLPEVPDFGETIRIRHLLQHTSGLREYLNLLLIGGRDIENGDVVHQHEVMRLVARQPELQSTPGEKFLYNNTAYVLLAEIVERVGGKPFGEWMAQNVFGPLGMEDAVVMTEVGQIIPRRTHGYTRTADGRFRHGSDLEGTWGPGGIYATAADLARWLANFREPRVGGTRVMDLMTTRGLLANGDTLRYALGLFIDQQRGLARVQHGGNTLGHAAQLHYFPDLDAGVIVLSNVSGGHAREIADKVAEAFFGEHMVPVAEAAQAKAAEDDANAEGDVVAPSAAVLERYAGEYMLPNGVPVTFTLEDGTLHTRIEGQPRFAMRALSDSSFQVLVPGIDARVVFHLSDSGPAQSATLHQGGQSIVVHRGEPWKPTAGELADYTGRYFSDELETAWTLSVQDDALVATHLHLGEVTLRPSARDAFRGSNIALMEVEFRRDADGRVTGLSVSNGRTVGVWFERQD